MNAINDTSTQESGKTGIGPGERLQAARIQQGLTLDDVASRMHLSPGILEAIEENNFEEITAPIFVKGYLRHYARIVALDEDEMIQQYTEYYSEEDPPISSTSNTIPELSVTDARIKWTTYLVILVLAALLTAWWWNKSKDEEPTISLDSPEPTTDRSMAESAARDSATATAIPAAPAVSAQDSQPSIAEPSIQAQSEATQSAPTAAAGTVAEEAGAEGAAAAITDSATPAPTEPDEPVAVQLPEQGESGADTTASPQPVVNSSAPIAPSGSDKLRITVTADTWADIKDGSGYQMVYDLLRTDQLLELTGEAPFSVFLGNGRGVEIEFNGKKVEFSFRIRNDNTARLKIGG